MKLFVRGAAAIVASVVLFGGVSVPHALAQQEGVLDSERDRVRSMVGHASGRSLRPAASDIDLGAFERAVRHAVAGGEPLISPEAAAQGGQGLLMRMAQAAGQAPADLEVPAI